MLITETASPRCVWCRCEKVDPATVVGSHPRERWFHCSYCRRFFSVHIHDDPPGENEHAKAAARAILPRLILADA